MNSFRGSGVWGFRGLGFRGLGVSGFAEEALQALLG